MVIAGIIIIVAIAGVWLFLQTPRFGALPAGASLKKIQKSSWYRNNQFVNRHTTPQLTEGANFFSIMKEFFFDKSKQKIPPAPLPSVKSNLLNLGRDKNILVWFGHSSYFMQVDGKNFLVDPVFSGNASPLRFTTNSFQGSDIYTTNDLPEIDYLILTHDHWDHLDYRTILRLRQKIKKIITGLGVGAHLERWGFDHNLITEMDWYDKYFPESGFSIYSMPARHFSGRGLKRNKSIWSSFVLTTPGKVIYIGGDSGYDDHFTEIGKQFGPFDLVILEDGQYNRNWKYIHMSPEETVRAAMDLQAKRLLPVHWAKFSLSVHSWDEPIRRIATEAALRNVKLLHPMIGETVDLDRDQVFRAWWEEIQ
jgi:L-ascorbate metabolism protein UlaG (beta-lactamase superfamily)